MYSLKNTIIVTVLSLLLLGAIAQFLNVDFVPMVKATTTFFSHGFEGGDFGEDPETGDSWTGTTGSPSIITNPVYNGTYAMNATAENNYVYKTLTGQSEINASCYFRTNLVPDDTDEQIGFKRGYASSTPIFEASLFYSGGTRWKLVYRNGASWTGGYGDIKTINNNTWYSAKIYWLKHNSSGIVRLYINGILEVEVTSVDTDDYGDFTQLQVGWRAGTSSGSESYVDDVWVGLEGEEGGEGALEPEIIGFSTATSGTSCTFRVKWNATGSHYIFGTDNTGSWQNETVQACTNEWTNTSKTLNSTVGVVVQWRYWINDTNGDWASIPLQNLTTVEVYSMGAVTGYPYDIQSAIDTVNSNGGGNVYIPYGNFSYDWTSSSVTFTGSNDINIIGHSQAGCKGHGDNWEEYTATTIIHNSKVPPASGKMFYFGGMGQNPSVYGSVKISNIRFEATAPPTTTAESDYQDAIRMHQIPDFRISYCTFFDFCSEAVFITAVDTEQESSNVSCYGVIDHCYFTQPYKLTTPSPGANWYWGYGIHVIGVDYSFTEQSPWWNQTAVELWGQYGFRRWITMAYVEDCHFEYSRHGTVARGNGYYVSRYNLYDKPACGYQSASIDIHGAAYPGGRGGEYYNNTIIGASQNKKPWSPYEDTDSIGIGPRGGHNIIYDNNFTVDESNAQNYFLLFQNDESEGREWQYFNYTWVWNNTYTNSSFLQNNDPSTIREDIEYFLRAPNMTEDGFEYTPYTYPHPLVGEEEQQNSVVLNQPSNGATLDYYNVYFNYTATFYQGSIVNSSLWLNVSGNWQSVGSNQTTITNGAMHSINYTFSEDDTYMWNVEVWNSTANHWAISNYTLTISLEVTLTITKPENTTYSSETIPVELSASGGTIDKIWYNCWNGSWVYESNQTYTVPTNMENFVNGSYTFYGWANNTDGYSDQKTVTFTITITQEWGSWWGYWW